MGQGYLEYTTVKDWCCAQNCNAHLLYEGIATKPFINLYYELLEAGLSSDATAVLNFMTRRANWFKNTVYKNYSASDCGVYGTGANSGKYFPYVVKLDWKRNCS